MKADPKFIASLAAAFLLVAVMVLVSFQTFRQIETSTAARGLAYDSIIRADALLGDLVDMETAQRGFLATGDETFLQPYLALQDGIRGRLDAIRSALSSRADVKRVDTLFTLVDAKLAQMAKSIEMGRHQDRAGALAELARGHGRKLMESIRAEFAGLIEPEKLLVKQHDEELQSNLKRLFGLMVTASLFSLLFAFLFSHLIHREARNRIARLLQSETQRLLAMQEQLNRDLQQANSALLASEDRLAVTLDSIDDAVVATDAEGRITLINPCAERLTGWTRVEATGRAVEEVFHIIDQDTRQPSRTRIVENLTKGTQQSLALQSILVARDGSECIVTESRTPMRGQDGRVAGTVLVFRDVTNEDAARQALREQQFYTRSLIESNIDALMTTDPSGIITDANRQMEALSGYTRDELIGAPFKKFFTDPERAEAGIKLVLLERNVRDYELTARASDGRQTAVSFNATTFYNRQRVLQGVFAAARDVTERKRLDQVLHDRNVELERSGAAAEKANLAKSDFLSNMSHELRTPLSAILGFAQLMESGTPSPTVSQKKSIDQILKAGWYLLELINEILDLALIESGKLPLSLEPISLTEVVRECYAMIEPQAQKRDIRMVWPEYKLPYYVKADRTRVKQVLINLLSNAVKYNKIGGTVVLECIASTLGRIRVCVNDTGPGLTPTEVAQLFQPFNRLGKETGVEEGTGIGLIVSKRLVELMHGAIGVESTLGKGSVFWFELNLTAAPSSVAAADASSAVARAPVAAGGRVRTLLYVEDNPANLMLVEDLIARRPDIRFLSATNGNSGVATARACLPDVILMDINLPGISGIKALEMLRADPATAHIPVVALSANAIPRDIELGMKAGFHRYLTKPIKVNEFMDTLDEALAIFATQSARLHKEAGKT